MFVVLYLFAQMCVVYYFSHNIAVCLIILALAFFFQGHVFLHEMFHRNKDPY